MKSTLRLAVCTGMLMVCGCPLNPPITGTTDIVDARITASATQGPGPLTVTFSGAASTSRGGAIVGYRWDFAGDGTADTVDATHTFTAPGRYLVTLAVTDSAGNVGVEAVNIRVQGQNPVAVIAVDKDSGTKPLLVRFDGTASRAEDDVILDYYWDFDDGETSRLPNPQHMFKFNGQFVVTLRVITAGGAEGSTTTTITVTDGIASLQFDGTQLATLPVTPAQALSEFTFEAWCLPDARGGTLASIGNGALLLDILPDSNVIRLQRGNEAVEITAAGLAGRWVHVAMGYNASGAQIVINGTALESIDFTGEVSIPSISVGLDFEGRIGDVRLWSIARDAGTINSQASIRLTGLEGRLLAYWPMNEGFGERLRNLAPGGADGFLGTTEAIEAADPAWSPDGPPF